MNPQPLAAVPDYDPLADFRRRYPRWRIDLTELADAPMVAVAHDRHVVTLSLEHLARDRDETVATMVAMLDIYYGPPPGVSADRCITELVMRRLGRALPSVRTAGATG